MADPMFASHVSCVPMSRPATGRGRVDFSPIDRLSALKVADGHFVPIRLKPVVSWRFRNAELAPRRRRSPSELARVRTVNPRKEDRR